MMIAEEAVKPIRQHMDQETADEFIGRKGRSGRRRTPLDSDERRS
jgi:hypothetical protein